MPIQGLDPEKCRSRNRIAARRDSVETAGLRFLRGDELSARGQRGSMPQGPEAVMAAINGLLPAGAAPLSADDVFVHIAEAANTNFIPDRYAFMDRSTLRNIAADAARGVAFMNSHRTGGMSTPSELPFGKTFAGRYDEDEEGARATIGVYMLRHNSDGEPLRPTGANGPSTADLHAMIVGGVIADTSVGLYGSDRVCDVCGTDLEALGPAGEYACPHAPGTTHGMDDGQQRAQTKRGVTRGRCSYSICNGRLSEQSAVYDGAVPGAGIRKVLSMGRHGLLGVEALAQGREAFAPYLHRHDLPEDPHGSTNFGLQGVVIAPHELQLDSLRPLSDERIEAIFPPGDSEPPTGPPFADHSHSVLTAVSEYLARVRDYAALRESKGRPLSPERRAEFQRLHEELGQVLAATLPRADPAQVLALQARILRRHASRREAAFRE